MQFQLLPSLAFITVGCFVFVSGEAALPPQDPTSRQDPQKTPVTLEEVLAGAFGARGFGGSWVPGSDNVIRSISGGNVWEYDMTSGSNETVVHSSNFTELLGEGQLAGLSFSADRKFVLVEHSRRALWRHSFLAKYAIYEIETGIFVKLVPTGEPEDPQPELQLVQWTPTDNGVAFVFNNNIYYKASFSAPVTQITTDGGDDIFNGISDWVYEEEMFGSPVALWFSKDSSNLAFVRFDDTLVETFSWPVYGEPNQRESVYPVYEPVKYPKSGRTNPEVSMKIVNLSGSYEIKTIQYPAGQDKSLQYYIATAIWASNTDLILVNLNRAQNQSTWHLCKSTDASCVVAYSREQVGGWIDAHTPTIFGDGSRILTLQGMPQADDAGKSYTQIVSILLSTGEVTPVTSGAMCVGSILGLDEANGKVYFSSTGLHAPLKIADPSESQIYYVQSQNTTPICITCDQKNSAGEACRSNSLSFSAAFSFYTHSCRGPGVPEIITKKTLDNSPVKVWVDNKELSTALASKAIPSTRDFEVALSSGFMAKVRLYLPADFNENEKYPLLIDVYAGPDSQKNTQDYKVDWGTYLTSSKGIIYGSIDARGSAKQSDELKFTVYRNLGSAEIEDQIEATKKFIESNSFIDAEKTAIWGWSYGGYATAMVLGKDTENVFKCGISVAPVTSWLYYDTIYTERYMGLPSDEDNWVNYNASAVMNYVENFKQKEFLLIHGNADDNVHYQQSMMLARSLEKSDVMFEQLSYPEENHSIGGQFMRRHLYHSIERFLERNCFSGTEAPETTPTGGSSSTDPAASTPNGGSTLIFNLFAMILTVIITFYNRL